MYQGQKIRKINEKSMKVRPAMRRGMKIEPVRVTELLDLPSIMRAGVAEKDVLNLLGYEKAIEYERLRSWGEPDGAIMIQAIPKRRRDRNRHSRGNRHLLGENWNNDPYIHEPKREISNATAQSKAMPPARQAVPRRNQE